MKKDNSNSNPTFTEEQYKFLSSSFPTLVITPEHSLSTIQHNAGSLAVLELVRRNIGFTKQRSLRDER